MSVNPYNKVILLVAVVFTAYSAAAQSNAAAMTSASIITPIGITKNVDMNFGNASVSTSVGGSVALTPGGSRSTFGGGVTLPATAGTVSAATFTVSGAPGFSFAITLPATAVITGPGGAKMTVNNFTSLPANTGMLSSGGNASVAVGATLVVSAGQALGSYANVTAIPVTVNYN